MYLNHIKNKKTGFTPSLKFGLCPISPRVSSGDKTKEILRMLSPEKWPPKRMSKFGAGFTIIELLVVIAIISILASIIWTSLNSAKVKARDARRRLDLQQTQLALELYFDKNNSYPSTGGAWWGVSEHGGSRTTSGVNAYIPQLTPIYIRALPIDPLDKRTGWAGYLYNSDGSHYKIIALDAESFPEDNVFYDPVRPTWAWMMCDNEPACSSW